MGSLNRGPHLCGWKGNRAQAYANRVEYSVGNRRWDHGGRRLSRAPWRLVRAVDELHNHLRHLRESKDWISCPVQARDARAVECHPLLQRPAQGLHDIALDLIFDPIRVDDLTAIMDNKEARNADVSRVAVDFDFGHGANIGAIVLI